MATHIAAMPLLSASGLLGRPAPAPYPLDQAHVSLWYGARAALWQGVRALGLRDGDRILVPAYHCGSEVDAFVKARLAVDFYHVRPDLTPDLDHVVALCNRPARALCVTHYFGVAQPMEQIVSVVTARGLLLVEDNAHGLYSTDRQGRPLGSFGDMAVWSFTKMLPLPDGGALLLRPERVDRDHAFTRGRPDPLRVAGKVKHLVEQALAHRAPGLTSTVMGTVVDPLTARIKAVVYREPDRRGADPAEDEGMRLVELVAERAGWAISPLAARLLARSPHAAVRDRRIRNFQTLGALVRRGRRVSPLVPELPSGACPSWFPVRVDDAEPLHRFLAGHGVDCLRFWSFFHRALPKERFPFEAALKRSVLALPVHQDLGEEDMAHLASLLDRWNGERSTTGGR